MSLFIEHKTVDLPILALEVMTEFEQQVKIQIAADRDWFVVTLRDKATKEQQNVKINRQDLHDLGVQMVKMSTER